MVIVRSKWTWICLAILAIGAGVWGWMDRGPLLAWHYARQLERTSEEERAGYVERLAPLESAAIPPLLERLGSSDETACANCGWTLVELAKRWGTNHAASGQLAAELSKNFPTLPPSGRRQALEILDAIITASPNEAPSKRVIASTGSALESAASADTSARPAALNLAVHFIYQARPQTEDLLGPCRKLAAAGLKDDEASCRADAVRLAAAPGIDMLDQLEPFLADSAAEVRRIALLALAPREDLVATDELLPLLHDPDQEVRALCEKALRGRGLRNEHIELAKSMTDQRPGVRAQVPAQLEEFPDLDARIWLERLSRDSAPAVRAAVVRVAGGSGDAQLQQRLHEMARQDPSPTVRQIASFYLVNPTPIE